MISRQAFGRTGHTSIRIVFGAYALSEATQAEADQVLELLLEYGVNHIDTAAMYGYAEERMGPWLEKHRADLFIAKTYNTYFYEPLDSQAAIDRAVHWALGAPDIFLITAGDMRVLPKILDAASRFEARPSAAEMADDVVEFDIQPIFQ